MNSIQNTALLPPMKRRRAAGQRTDHPDRWYMEAGGDGAAGGVTLPAGTGPAGSGDQAALHKPRVTDRPDAGRFAVQGAVRWETRCSLPPQNPMAVLETLPSVAASSSPLTRNAKPAPYRDVFSRWTMFPFTMYWGGMTAAFRGTLRPLCPASDGWNTLSWRSGICVKQRPGGTPNTGHRQLHQRPRKTQCRRWEA